MIVRASQPLMRGAQLTPVMRSYTGPRRGLHLVARRRGLGDAATVSLAQQNITRDFNSFVNNLGYAVEQGQVVSPDVMLRSLQDRVAGVCSDVLTAGAGCDPHVLDTQVAQLATQYAQALAQKQADTAALVAAGAISVPAGYYGGQNLYQQNYAPPTLAQANANLAAVNSGAAYTAPPPPAVTSTAPVTTAPVQSNAPASAVATVPTPASPTVVQSNAPGAAVVIPGVASATSFLTQSAFFGIPNWGLGLAVLGLGYFLFAGKGR